MILKIHDPQEKSRIAERILTGLSEWFGMPESTANYIKQSRELPFWAAIEEDIPVGFIALNPTSEASAEVYVMGVLPEYHRRGLGRKLYESLEQYAQGTGYRFVQVKTVKMGCYPSYDKTNRFYQAMGFSELECFPQLWDEWNPCQIYVKYIG